MSAAIDEAVKRLLAIQPELEKQIAQPLNEASTRFRILDRFLIEVLQWHSDNIETEAAVTDGFVDYTLNAADGRAVCIIEAKRVGKLQTGTATNKTSSLLIRGSVLKTLIAPIKQALGYASLKGVPIACVTDGSAWLFFQANRRDGKSVIDGHGIYFPSLTAVIADFPKFHDLLSGEGLQSRLGLVQLNRAEGLSAAGEESQAFVSPPDQATLHERNALSQDASLLFSQFFSTITSDGDGEMLTRCFVETPESKKADLELQKIAQKLLNGVQSLDTASSAALQDEIERAVNAMSSETVLIIGNKGSGKTTFLTRFFSDVLSAELQKSCVVLRVGLELYGEEDFEKLPIWAIRELRDQAEIAVCGGKRASFDDLRGVFWAEYNRQKNGTLQPLYESDRSAFLIRFGEYLERLREEEPEKYLRAFLERAVHGQKQLPCIIFDNADQFSAKIQDSIFQLAHSLGATTPVLNVVPITDRTVWRLSKAGALQSYNAKSFYLPVPEAKQILQKRIDYVKNKLNNTPDMAKSYFSARGFRVTIENIDRFAQAVERIFIDNDFVSGLIGKLANFDIRRMLMIAERIFLSPEIRIDEVIKGSFGYRPGVSETLRIHRAIVKGEYDRYSPNENPYIYNIFWTDPVSPASPLVAFYLLWTLRARMNASRADSIDSRHWTVGELSRFLEACGCAQEQTEVVLQRLRDRVLVETLDPNILTLTSGDRVAITDSGIAHIELALGSAVYLEQMAMATGINNNRIYQRIRDLRTQGNAAAFDTLRHEFADYLIELDTLRLSMPTAREYDALRDAKKHFRGRGTVSTNAAASHAAIPAQQRTSPAPSVGTTFKRRGR